MWTSRPAQPNIPRMTHDTYGRVQTALRLTIHWTLGAVGGAVIQANDVTATAAVLTALYVQLQVIAAVLALWAPPRLTRMK
jgi:hypothetical protein